MHLFHISLIFTFAGDKSKILFSSHAFAYCTILTELSVCIENAA